MRHGDGGARFSLVSSCGAVRVDPLETLDSHVHVVCVVRSPALVVAVVHVLLTVNSIKPYIWRVG